MPLAIEIEEEQWNHTLCGHCWVDREGEFSDDDKEQLVGLRWPIRLNENVLRRCCRCGRDTFEGIFVRADVNSMNCGGKHPSATPVEEEEQEDE